MNCNSKITYDKDCNIIIHDINFDENYAYIYILQLNKSNETITQVAIKEVTPEEIIIQVGNPNSDDIIVLDESNICDTKVIGCGDSSMTIIPELQVKFDKDIQDGFYTLVTVKVPMDPTKEYYYRNGKVYHINEEADLALLLELNPEVSGLEVEHEYYFQTCRLRKCYINICKQIFDQVHSLDCNKPPIDPNLKFKRDLLLSALHIIEFMVERGQFKEAELLLERIMGCNGLCDDHHCGCHKHSPCSCGCL